MENSNTYYFCPMRKVRVYLKKLRYYSNVNVDTTFSILQENTNLYLKGQISSKFYANLAEELLQRGSYHTIWNESSDMLMLWLKLASTLRIAKSKSSLSRLNHDISMLNQKCTEIYSLPRGLSS